MGFYRDLMGFYDSNMAILINFAYPYFLPCSIGDSHWRIPKTDETCREGWILNQWCGYHSFSIGDFWCLPQDGMTPFFPNSVS
jgi:hypothetical protein